MKSFSSLVLKNSCYWSCACGQIFICLGRHTNESKGSIQSTTDPFASFACQTADNCDKNYCPLMQRTLAERPDEILCYPVSSDELKPYFTRTHVLSVDQRRVLWRMGVIIPPSLRNTEHKNYTNNILVLLQ